MLAGTHDYSVKNVHSGQLPRRIFVAFVDNQAFSGDYTMNPFNFEHLKIKEISVQLNGHQFPPKLYKPDFEQKLFIRELNGFYEALNMLNNDSTCNINRSNYHNGNTIFGWNFAPDLSEGCGNAGHLNQIHS